MRTTAARRLQTLSRLPLLLLPLLLVSLPHVKVYVDDVPVGVESGPGQPQPCLDDVTGIDIPDDVYKCNHASWCLNAGFESVRQSVCPPID